MLFRSVYAKVCSTTKEAGIKYLRKLHIISCIRFKFKKVSMARFGKHPEKDSTDTLEVKNGLDNHVCQHSDLNF